MVKRKKSKKITKRVVKAKSRNKSPKRTRRSSAAIDNIKTLI